MAKGQDLGPVIVSFSADASKYLRVTDKIIRKAVKVRQKLEGEARQQANEIIRQTQKMSEEVVKEIDKTTRKVAASMNRLGRTIAIGFSAPISLGLMKSVQSFARLDRAIVNTGAIFGNVTAKMKDRLADFTQQLATKTIFSAGDLSEAFIRVARTGVDAETGIKILGTTAEFAQASMLELADASTILFDALAALGKKDIKNSANMLRDLTRLADLLTFAANKSQATSEELAIALSRKAGAAFRVANISMEEGIALLQVYAEQGIKGALAGERTEIFLRELARAQKKSSELWHRLGLRLTDTKGRLLPLADILKQLEDQFRNLGPVQLRTNLETLGFQQRAIAATLNLIGFSEKLREFTRLNEQAGSVVRDLAKDQMTSFANSMKVLINQVDNASQKLGKQLAPIIESVAEVIAFLSRLFESLPEGVQKFIAVFAGLSVIAGPALIGFGQLIFFGKEVIKLIEASSDAAKKRKQASDSLVEGYKNEAEALAAINAQLGQLQKQAKLATPLKMTPAPTDFGEQFGPPKPPPEKVTNILSKRMRDKRGRILSAEVQKMLTEGNMLNIPEDVLRNLPDIPGQKHLFAKLSQGGFRRRFPEKKISDRPKGIVPKRASQNIDEVSRAMDLLSRASEQADPKLNAVESAVRRVEAASKESSAGVSELEQAMARIQKAAENAKKSADKSSGLVIVQRSRKKVDDTRISAIEDASRRIADAAKNATPKLSELEKANQRIANAAKEATPQLTEMDQLVERLRKSGGGSAKVVNDIEAATNRLAAAARNATPELSNLEQANERLNRAVHGPKKVKRSNIEEAINRIKEASQQASPSMTELEKANKKLADAAASSSEVITEGGIILKRNTENIEAARRAQEAYKQSIGQTEAKLISLYDTIGRAAPELMQQKKEVDNLLRLSMNQNATTASPGTQLQFNFGDNQESRIERLRREARALAEIRDREMPLLMKAAKKLGTAFVATGKGISASVSTIQSGVVRLGKSLKDIGTSTAKRGMDVFRKSVSLASAGMKRFAVATSSPKEALKFFVGGPLALSIKGLTTLASVAKRAGTALKGPLANGANAASSSLMKLASSTIPNMISGFRSAVASSKILSIALGGLKAAVKALKVAVASMVGAFLLFTVIDFAIGKIKEFWDAVSGKKEAEEAVSRSEKVADYMTKQTDRILSGIRKIKDEKKKQLELEKGLKNAIDVQINKRKKLSQLLRAKSDLEEVLSYMGGIADKNSGAIQTGVVWTRDFLAGVAKETLPTQKLIQKLIASPLSGVLEDIGYYDLVENLADVPAAYERIKGKIKGMEKELRAAGVNVEKFKEELEKAKEKIRELDQAALEKVQEETKRMSRDIKLMNPSLTTVEKGFMNFRNQLEDIEAILGRVPEKVRIDFEIKGVQKVIAELTGRIKKSMENAQRSLDVSTRAFFSLGHTGASFSEATRIERLKADRDAKLDEIQRAREELRKEIDAVGDRARKEGRLFLTKEEQRKITTLAAEMKKLSQAERDAVAEFEVRKFKIGVDILGKLNDKAREARKQIALFRLPQGARRDALELSQQIADYKRQLIAVGIPMNMINIHLAAFKKSQEDLVKAKAFEKLRQDAEKLNESLKSPEKKFEEQFKRLKQMRLAGLISQQVFDKRLIELKDQFAKDKEKEEKDKAKRQGPKKSPLQLFQEERQRIIRGRKRGLFDNKEFRRRILEARERFTNAMARESGKSPGKTEIRKSGAFEAGTVEAASAISKAITERQNLQNKQLQELKKQNQLTQQTNQIMNKVNNSLKNKPVPSVATGVP